MFTTTIFRNIQRANLYGFSQLALIVSTMKALKCYRKMPDVRSSVFRRKKREPMNRRQNTRQGIQRQPIYYRRVYFGQSAIQKNNDLVSHHMHITESTVWKCLRNLWMGFRNFLCDYHGF